MVVLLDIGLRAPGKHGEHTLVLDRLDGFVVWVPRRIQYLQRLHTPFGMVLNQTQRCIFVESEFLGGLVRLKMPQMLRGKAQLRCKTPYFDFADEPCIAVLEGIENGLDSLLVTE